jgi:hypothetical protein
MKLFQKIGIIILMILSLVAVLVMVGLSIENFMRTQSKVIKSQIVCDKNKTAVTTTSLNASIEKNIVYIATSPQKKQYLYAQGMYAKRLVLFGYSTTTLPKDFSIKPILYIPNDAYLNEYSHSFDLNSKKMIFVVMSNFGGWVIPPSLNNEYSISGAGVSIFSYDYASSTAEFLFNTIKEYPMSINTSGDGRYIFFNMVQCYSCEPVGVKNTIFDTNENYFKKIPKVSAFEWLKDGNYRYKDLIERECKQSELGEVPCFKDPKDLPWKYGKF